MGIVFFVLAVVAAAMIVGLIVGVALELIGLLLMAVLAVAAVLWIRRLMRKDRTERPTR